MRIRLLTQAEFLASGLPAGDRLLGVIGLGAPRPPGLAPDVPFATADLPVVGGPPLLEIWEADGPVRTRAEGGMRIAESESALFGLIRVDATMGRDLAPVARTVYAEIFAAMDAASIPTLLRVHNYIGAITQIDAGTERYHRFNAGRHEAFAARAKAAATAPAACALGTTDDALLVYFLAARGTATPIENPRQLSAYRYPPQHGPQPPIFARATIGHDGGAALFLSGTASIVGHESLHPGNVAMQARETLRNLAALMAQCGAHGVQPAADGQLLKVYLRHADDRDRVAAVLDEAGLDGQIAYLRAEICRPELLVEIEGFTPLDPVEAVPFGR